RGHDRRVGSRHQCRPRPDLLGVGVARRPATAFRTARVTALARYGQLRVRRGGPGTGHAVGRWSTRAGPGVGAYERPRTCRPSGKAVRESARHGIDRGRDGGGVLVRTVRGHLVGDPRLGPVRRGHRRASPPGYRHGHTVSPLPRNGAFDDKPGWGRDAEPAGVPMTDSHSGDAPIVVGVDDTEAAMKAARWAALAAAQREAPLHLLHASGFSDPYIIGFTVPPPEAFKEELREQKHQALHTAETIAEEVGVSQVVARSEADAAIPCLLRASRTARMVVLGSSGRTKLTGLLVGSTTLALVSHAHCPVVSVRGDHPDAFTDDTRPVVVGVDGSELSDQAVGHAFEEASLRNVDLIAVHTWSDTDTALFKDQQLYYNWEPIHDYESRLLTEHLASWEEQH